jgi:predicted nucleic acid-binding protein
MSYLWDTNVVIYYLQKQFPLEAEVYIDTLISSDLPIISSISEIELLCWNTQNENDIKIVKDFVKQINVIELESKIKEKTVEIRKQYKIKLPDAIIAATAIVYDLTLITRNKKDFDVIAGLITINPFEI